MENLANEQYTKKIVNSIYEADVAVIDGVHITEMDAARIGREGKVKVKNLYLMPIRNNRTEADVLNNVELVYNKVYIPKDLEEFKI